MDDWDISDAARNSAGSYALAIEELRKRLTSVAGLKPCPFCGSETSAHVRHEVGRAYVLCTRCGSQGPTAPSKGSDLQRIESNAIGMWNLRK